MKSFKVIEIKNNGHDGVSYEYVTKIDVSYYGKIVIVTSPNVLDAMKFVDEAYYEEKEKRELMLKLVKTHFPKNDYTISYRTLNIEVK